MQTDKSRWLYVVQLGIPAEHESAFNHLYDTDHVPALLAVDGVNGCERYRLEWADCDDMPAYLALYTVDGPEVPRSAAWKTASNSGEWPTRIRPHLNVRKHGMFRREG